MKSYENLWIIFLWEQTDNAGKTKLPTIVNIVQLFGICIPLFILLTRFYGFGIEAIAWSIFVSNAIDAILSIIFVIYAVIDLKSKSVIEENNNEKLFAAITALEKLTTCADNEVAANSKSFRTCLLS